VHHTVTHTNERISIARHCIDAVVQRQQRDRRRTKDDKEIYMMARPFLQLTNSEYHEEFIKGLLGMLGRSRSRSFAGTSRGCSYD